MEVIGDSMLRVGEARAQPMVGQLRNQEAEHLDHAERDDASRRCDEDGRSQKQRSSSYKQWNTAHKEQAEHWRTHTADRHRHKRAEIRGQFISEHAGERAPSGISVRWPHMPRVRLPGIWANRAPLAIHA